jgi:two-component system sensor histidine kinase PilS (NtrC family)
MADGALIPRVKALIGFRALIISLLLGAAFLFKVALFPKPGAISLLIILLYLLTILYALLLQRIRNLFLFAYIQLFGDLAAEIALIYMTGGIESWFSFMLILTVLSSSIVLNRKAGFVMAIISSILYGTLLDLQFYRILPSVYDSSLPVEQFLYKVFIHTVALYSTAYLAGHLSSRLEKTVERLEEKDIHLKELELFNTKVIESLPSGLFTTDLKGTVFVFNRAAERISGFRKEAVVGGFIGKALPFISFPIREGRTEERLTVPGQEQQKIVGITISVLKDASGNRTGYIGIFQDLSQLKKLEAEMKNKEKWAAIGELSANIAHEIRNPLASLRGSIEMLRENRVPEKHREKLMGIALNEMERLNSIITDFLTYSRPKPLEIRETDLHALLGETLELLRNAEESTKGITITGEFGGELLLSLDPMKVRQVFWNLGINALQAMKPGGTLTVSTRDDDGRVVILFSDTGDGIAETELPKIFFPFYTTKENGTGLGLAIAYRIIEEHHGKISVQSRPGIKTTFEIILPKEHGT